MRDEFEPDIVVARNTSSKDNVVVIGMLFSFVVLLSNIITYHLVTMKTNKAIMASERKQKIETVNMITNQITASKEELVNNWEYTNAQVDTLESKYYNLETLLTSAERRGSVVTIVK